MGRHTADNIIAQYDEVLSNFNIGDRVGHIITDNASNMVKAFSLPGYTDTLADSDNEASDSEDTLDVGDTNSDGGDLFAYFPQHDGCFAHTTQLIVKDGMKDAGALRTVISKASSIVSHVRKSTVSSEILESYRKLQAANATRWNSGLAMIRSLLRIPQDTLDQLDTTHKLSHHDRILLSELCDILSPFEAATDFTQGDKVVTATLVIPSVRGLRSQLQVISVKYNCKIVSTLKKSIDTRLSIYEETASFRLAATLDPRFKLAWCSSQPEATDQRASLQAAANKLSPPPPELPTALSTSASSPPTKRCRLFNFMNSSQPTPTVNISDAVAEEVSTYLSQPWVVPESEDPLHYWCTRSGSMPTLARLATQYLAIPATSAPVERLFSVAGKAFRPDRSRLTDSHFQDLMFGATSTSSDFSYIYALSLH